MNRHLATLFVLVAPLFLAFPARAGSGAAAAGSPASVSSTTAGIAVGKAVRVLTLAEAVELARAHSPGLASLRAVESASAARLDVARSARWPEVDLSAGYARWSHVPELVLELPGVASRTLFPDLPDNYRTRLSLALPLFTGGQISGRIDEAGEELSAAGKDLTAATADLVLETSAAYWDLVTARETERVLSESLAAYDAHLEDAKNRERLGMAARNEVLAVEVERDRAELGRLRAANASEVEAARLARLVGVPANVRLEPAEPLAPPEAPDEDLEALVTEALAARPERAALVSRVAAAEAAIRAEKGAWWPQASIVAGYDYANPNRRIVPPGEGWTDSWDVSVNLSLTLFQGGKRSAAVAGATARAEAIRRQLADLDERIRLEVTSRFLDLRTSKASIPVAERNLEAARENRRVSLDRYREGVSQSSDLLDAETALLRAGLDRTEALTRAHLAVASLRRATGR